MDDRRRVPEDLMGTILGAGSGVSDEEDDFTGTDSIEAGSGQSPGDLPFKWEENPERVGVAFNLSKQLGAELDRTSGTNSKGTRTPRSLRSSR